MDLERCTGPACPRCGCKDADILRDGTPQPTAQPPLAKRTRWWSDGQAICNHCNQPFYFTPPPLDHATPPPLTHAHPTLDGVRDLTPTPDLMPDPSPPRTPEQLAAGAPATPQAILCPKCGSAAVRVYSTRPNVRYYRCKDCENRFKKPRRPITKTS